jgi:hypothetical protein
MKWVSSPNLEYGNVYLEIVANITDIHTVKLPLNTVEVNR